VVRLLLLADTHVPARARDLPAQVWAVVDAADVVIHAGDWISADLVTRLSDRARRLVGCWGNNDGPSIRAVLPEVARVTLDGLRFVVVHETGSAAGRDRRMAAAYPDADVLVFGHSHIPWDATIERPPERPPATRPGRPPDSPIVGAPGPATPASGTRSTAPAAGAPGTRPGTTAMTKRRPLRLLNPGSPTDRRRQPTCTYLTAAVDAGILHDVELHHLPSRRPS
jgi:hypothetical protein